ncbi:MAG: hypothetical protein MUE46_06000 [Xanthomonadales bacterium]|jgi:hypothetical protein|nr:hypothetical protein [Xanthomonadales bacterium]
MDANSLRRQIRSGTLAAQQLARHGLQAGIRDAIRGLLLGLALGALPSAISGIQWLRQFHP